MNTLIVVADLGCLKAFQQSQDPFTQSKSIDLLEEVSNPEAHQRFGEGVTDQAGRFPRGGSEAGGMSYGENHQSETENQKRRVKFIAENVNRLVEQTNPPQWHFAAPQHMNRAILDLVRSDLRDRLKKNLALDLTKAPHKELLERFN